MAAITAGADPIPVPSATNDPPPTQTNVSKPTISNLFLSYNRIGFFIQIMAKFL
jgi:hypothetical protein